jgi:hypothetical protein
LTNDSFGSIWLVASTNSNYSKLGGRAIQISEVIKIGGGLLRVKLLQNRWRDLALAVRQLKCRCKGDVTQVILSLKTVGNNRSGCSVSYLT